MVGKRVVSGLRRGLGQSLQTKPKQHAERSDHGRSKQSREISANYQGERRVRDPVRYRGNGEKPDWEQREPVAFLQPDHGEYPDAQPGQIENYEEIRGPRREA